MTGAERREACEALPQRRGYVCPACSGRLVPWRIMIGHSVSAEGVPVSGWVCKASCCLCQRRYIQVGQRDWEALHDPQGAPSKDKLEATALRD